MVAASDIGVSSSGAITILHKTYLPASDIGVSSSGAITILNKTYLPASDIGVSSSGAITFSSIKAWTSRCVNGPNGDWSSSLKIQTLIIIFSHHVWNFLPMYILLFTQ